MRSALLASSIFLLAIFSCAQNAIGQCPPGGPTAPPPPPAFSATTGGDYGQISLAGSSTDPCATTTYYFVLSNGTNSQITQVSGTQQWNFVFGGLGSNWTYFFRAQSTNSLGSSAMVTVSAATRDLPNPLIAVWTGPGPDKVTVWSRFLGQDPNHVVPVHVHMITPGNVDTNLANFHPEDVGPKVLGFSPSPGLYTFYSISDTINPGLETKRSSNLYLYIDANGDQHWGNPGCNGVHKPVDVTTGNMYVSETDYSLPGIGESIVVERSYNSYSTYSGIFGAGWSTQYDETLTAPSSLSLRLQMPDGRAIYFGRPDAAAEIYQSASHDFRGQVRKHADNTYSLEMPDGRIHKYGTDGRLLWLRDRNGNQTTLNYTSGLLTGVTDAFGRTVTFVLNTNGTVAQMSDSLGVIATYAYVPSTDRLQSVTYPDGSKRQYAYTTVNGRSIIQTITDALGNILETHQYDSQGRATTSELGGNIEKHTLDYSNPTKTVVMDVLGNVTITISTIV